MQTLHDGPGVGASIAATIRTRGDYRAAFVIENFYGERRTWDARGQTQHIAFLPPCDEFDNRIWGGEPDYSEADYRG